MDPAASSGVGDNTLTLYAPNRFVLDWVRDKYLLRVNGIINELCGADAPPCVLISAIVPILSRSPGRRPWCRLGITLPRAGKTRPENKPEPNHKSNTNVNYTFENFVEG